MGSLLNVNTRAITKLEDLKFENGHKSHIFASYIQELNEFLGQSLFIHCSRHSKKSSNSVHALSKISGSSLSSNFTLMCLSRLADMPVFGI